MSVSCLIRCCIPQCSSTNISKKMYKFPTRKLLVTKWKAILINKYSNIKLGSDSQGKCQRYICSLHFEEKYIDMDGKRVPWAYPTLFSDTEILSRKPSDHYTIDVMMHTFPNPKKFPERFKAWVSLVGGDLQMLPDNEIYTKKRICDIHFKDNHRNRFNRLNALAVPSLFLPDTSDCVGDILTYDRPTGSHAVTTAVIEDVDVLVDHGYASRHFDHNYCKTGAESQLDIELFNLGLKLPKDDTEPPAKKQKTWNKFQRKPLILLNKIENAQPSLKENGQTVCTLEYNVLDSLDADTDIRSVSPVVPDPEHEPEPEPEPATFSWQKSIPICVEKDGLLPDDSQSAYFREAKPEVKNKSEDDEGKEKEENYKKEIHAEFSCDHCLGDIIGYTCVQCENFDLCSACESRLVHPQHYTLRVPRPRPYKEIRSVISAIRHKLALLEESLRQTSCDWDDVEIKKEEDPFAFDEAPVPDPVPPGDPLEQRTETNCTAQPYEPTSYIARDRQFKYRRDATYPLVLNDEVTQIDEHVLDISQVHKRNLAVDNSYTQNDSNSLILYHPVNIPIIEADQEIIKDDGNYVIEESGDTVVNTEDTFEEYLDEMWLDETILKNDAPDLFSGDINKPKRGRTK